MSNCKSEPSRKSEASELLQKVRLIDPVAQTDRVVDVLISDGIITAIDQGLSPDSETTQVYSCQGMVLGPGLVDLYSHSAEPGFEARETLNSLVEAAAQGGFTHVAILPDTLPAIDHPTTLTSLEQKSQALRQQSNLTLPQLHYWGALTLDLAGKQMTEPQELAEAGIVGFTDNCPIQNMTLLRRLLEYLQPFQKPIGLWPCYLELVGNGVMREGPESIRFGLPGNPTMAESSALAALLEMVAATGAMVHIMRVSTARSIELLRSARAAGLPITASTTWMHLLHNTQSISTYDPNLRLEPPLGSPADQLALQQAVQEGILDGIAIDHTPYTYEEKTVAFAEAPPGAIGLELALTLLWQTFVESGQWTALELWQAISTNPARCLGLPSTSIQPGQPADLTLFDPKQSWLVDSKTLKSLSNNTPWLGKVLTGRVIQTWIPRS